MTKTKVLLAEDHTLVRAGFRALLEKLDGVQVIGEVSDGREALRMSKEAEPDVVLMDIAMPGMNGLEATSRMRQECPRTKVLMLSMYTNEEYLQEALRAGAAGYLLKDADRAELELAIKTVCRGETYLTPAVAKFTLDAYCRQGRCASRTLRTSDRAPAGNSAIDCRRVLDETDRTTSGSERENRRNASGATDGTAGDP